jgi:hypothetical protein
VPRFPKVATLKPDLEFRRDMKWHLLQDRIVASEGRIDHGKIPLVREIEEIHLYFPARLPIKDFGIPGNLGRYFQSAAQVRFLLSGDLRSDTKTKAPGSLVNCVSVEINFRCTRQRIVTSGKDDGDAVWPLSSALSRPRLRTMTRGVSFFGERALMPLKYGIVGSQEISFRAGL